MGKKLCGVLLALVLALSLLPTVAAADSETSIGTGSGYTWSTTSDLLYYTLKEGNYKLISNVEVTATILVTGNVTLDLNGYVLNLRSKNCNINGGADATGSVIQVGDSSTNTAGHLTLKDSRANDESTKRYFTKDSTGLWKLCTTEGCGHTSCEPVTGGVITGGNKPTGDGESGGSGVSLIGSSGSKFTMTGGSIIGCVANNGGGVLVGNSYCTFEMENGLIAGCTANIGGGVNVNDANATFTMTGGTIRDCVATKTSIGAGGVSTTPHDSDALCVNGSMNANGGHISGTVLNNEEIANTSTEGKVTTFHSAVKNTSGGTISGSVGVASEAALTSLLKNGATSIKLMDDFAIEHTLIVTGTVTLDLNGHVLNRSNSSSSSSSGPVLVVGEAYSNKSGNLTIEDSSTGGKIINENGTTIDVGNGSLTLESGTVSCQSSGDNNYAITAGDNCTVTLKGAIVSAGTNSKAIKLSAENSSPTLNADGGTVNGTVDNESGTITHSDGVTTATKFTGTVKNGGTIEWGIYSGTVENYYEITGEGHYPTIIGGTISGGTFECEVDNDSNRQVNRQAATISGGTFNGEVKNGGTITGGTFSGKVTGDGTIDNSACPYTVTYDYNYTGSTSTKQPILNGQKATEPTDPTREGWKFDGWYEKDTNGELKADKFGFSTAITENTTLYAKWTCAGHTGGTATCQEQATCETCNQPYGEKNTTNHTGEKEWSTKNATQHEQTWKCCGAVVVALENHEWKDGVCKECEYACTHTGGTADCTHKAVCAVCGEEYGEVNSANHDFTAPVENSDTLKSAGTCKDKAVYYYSCSRCGEIEKNDTHTFEGELDSDNHTGTLGEWQKDENGHWKTYSCCTTVKGDEGAHSYTNEDKNATGALKTAGDCQNEAMYYKSCSVCGAVSTSDKDTFEGDKNPNIHTGMLGDWKKDENGHWKTYSCCTSVKGDEGAHTFGTDGKCACGAVEYTVTFYPNGGKLPDGTDNSATTGVDGKLSSLPTPTRSGRYRFLGWFTEETGGKEIEADTVFAVNTTVYAHWSRLGGSSAVTGTVIGATNYTSGIHGLTFKSSASFASFQGVQVDGKTINKSNYIAEEGSIEVYLKVAYLKTLSTGKHTVTILSTEGNATMDFTIGGVTSAKTGDAGIALYGVMTLLSYTGTALVVRGRKRA